MLALRVLWSLASALQTWLLAFLHAWIARQIAGLAQRRFKVGVHAYQCASERVTNGAGLPAGAAAHNANAHIVRIVIQIEHAQRRRDRCHHHTALPKIRLSAFAIYRDAAIAIGEEAHAGYRCFASPQAIVVIPFARLSGGIGHGRSSSFFFYLALAGCFNNACGPVHGTGFCASCGRLGPAYTFKRFIICLPRRLCITIPRTACSRARSGCFPCRTWRSVSCFKPPGYPMWR